MATSFRCKVSAKSVAMATSLSTSGLQSNTWFLGPIRAHNPNGILISSAVFAQTTTECSYTLQRDAPSPLKFKIAPSHGGSGHHLIHASLGPPQFSTQIASLSVQLFLQGSLVWQTDRLTDHSTASINQSISQFWKWPKWINRCKDNHKDSTNINNMNAALGVFLGCCRRYLESQQKSRSGQ